MTNENNLTPETNTLSDEEMNYAAAGKVTPPVVHCPKCGSTNNTIIIIPGYSGYRCYNCNNIWE